jgi:hypothetical protein
VGGVAVLLEPPPELVVLELAVLELLLQAAAPASVRAASTVSGTSGTRREARLASLPCFGDISPILAGRTGGTTAQRRCQVGR